MQAVTFMLKILHHFFKLAVDEEQLDAAELLFVSARDRISGGGSSINTWTMLLVSASTLCTAAVKKTKQKLLHLTMLQS